jgi:polar amino acid transport system ATP-binding protein/arginine:pyruvate transaminase
MQFSALVGRIRGDGADAWVTHYEAVAARDRGEDVIVLSVGDPSIDTPTPVVECAIERLRAGDTHYTPAPGRLALREAVARAHAARTHQAVSADNVIILAGTQNALFVASLCVAGPGDEVISFDPMYPTYTATIEVSGARMVRARQPAEQGFRPDLANLEALIGPRTRAIFFASPNNPTGVVLNESELDTIGTLAQRHSLWLIADEVYAGLAPGGRQPSLAAHLPEHVVTLGSLSKSHAMTGWRCGWLIGPRQLVFHAESIAMCMLFGLPGFIQEAALVALATAAEAESSIRAFCQGRRELLLSALRDVTEIRLCPPQAGMFMLVDVRGSGYSGREFMRALYHSQRVSVMDGGAVGRETEGFVRICFATDEATLIEACRRIRVFLKDGPAHACHERRAAG